MKKMGSRFVYWSVAFVFAGIVLRLILPSEIEYKWDEIQVVEGMKRWISGEALPWIGLHSSGGLRHPGFGVWIFMGLGRLFGAETAIGVSRITAVLSSLALLFGLIFALSKWVRADERESWLGGLSLAAINPHFILLERKIWTPCLMPLFSVIWIVSWHRRRESRAAVFVWGVVGALMGQIHLSGFFTAGALFLWTVLFDRDRKKIAWGYWVLGSILGALPSIPWVDFLMHLPPGMEPNFAYVRWVMMKYWNYWLSNPMGWALSANLGNDFYPFWREPFGTYLVGIAHGVLYGMTGLFVVLLFGRAREKLRTQRFIEWFGGKWKGSTDLDLLLAAGLWGAGILMTLAAININRYFLLALFPLSEVFVARVFLSHPWGKKLFHAFCAAQLVISASVMYFIAKSERIDGDFGVPFSRSSETSRSQSPGTDGK